MQDPLKLNGRENKTVCILLVLKVVAKLFCVSYVFRVSYVFLQLFLDCSICLLRYDKLLAWLHLVSESSAIVSLPGHFHMALE